MAEKRTTVEVKNKNGGVFVAIRPWRAGVSKKKKDKLAWKLIGHSAEALEIDFSKDKNPAFTTTTPKRDRFVRTRQAGPKDRPGSHRYSIIVHMKDRGPIEIDPEYEVER